MSDDSKKLLRVEPETAPELPGPADGHRTATGPCRDGAIAKLAYGTQITGVR
ncbi:hypothetical protein ACM6QF_13200 [Enterococcus faecium]|uniref:hypothetical protein n=1 Tax=Enterococcus faecium TaxID=1352 RepID=UPI0039FC0B10